MSLLSSCLTVATKLVTPPTGYPVSVNEVKDHARIDHVVDDARIGQIWIPAATEYVQDWTKLQLLNATWRASFSRFPRNGILELPNPPLVSITTVAYTDTNGDAQTVSSGDYQAETDSLPGRLAPARGESWPDIDDETLTGVQVTYVAGYGTQASNTIPASLKLAILTLCTHWYDRRDIDQSSAIVGPLRHSLDAMMAKHRIEPPNYEGL